MIVKGKTVLVLGGAGLVGQAVCRRLFDEGAALILAGGLTEAEARQAADDLAGAAGGSEVIPVWGNIFAHSDLAARGLVGPATDTDRARQLQDDLGALTDAAYLGSHLVQLVLGTCPMAPGKRPHVVVDTVNTATALAYGGVYDRLRSALASAGDGAADAPGLLQAFTTPRLVRHVQLLNRALLEAGTDVYIKVGTTGTGGMGLNIPYTHGEVKPSRTLLTKSALAGAHSMLLFLMARTPGGPAVKEVKPAAAITWKRISWGTVRRRGRPLALYDCPADEALELRDGGVFRLAGAGRSMGQDLESVFIDTGENGLFSVGEFSAITALGQMEAITPEEIARAVVREIKGQPTGHDIVSALDGAVMGPSYRAGVLRSRALAEARDLAADRGLASIAFEILGPPRLSKLLFETELLRRAFGSLDAVAAAAPPDIVAAWEGGIVAEDDLRRAAVSVGIPILLSDGRRLLAASRATAEHGWEQDPWTIDQAAVDHWAETEWAPDRMKEMTKL
ncbi:MAG: short-chain dehydrogenase, partial [Anaerolineae bacterium]